MGSHEISPAPVKKRRRAGGEPEKKRPRRGRRGLCELNIDELYIIFAYIYPMDLLSLARTCKSLRGILMHKSSLFLWKSALSKIEGLPPCPDDLTEPEYTNLVFYTRCHGCGKPAQTILWNMRRRYCPTCRVDRLASIAFCGSSIVFCQNVLPRDKCRQGNDLEQCVDKDQLESFMHEYNQSSDKTEFLNEKRKQCLIVSQHASQCERWKKQNGRIHRFDLEVLRKDRRSSIFERLRQHGYGPEIAHFGVEHIEAFYKSDFRSHNLLTDSEWTQMLPKWIEIMDDFRKGRLCTTLYNPRRRLLVSEYNRYVTHQPPNTPTFDLLPNVIDLARFSAFQDIIKAPEEAGVDGPLFTDAFAQLPVFVSEWRKQLDTDLARLIKFPPDSFLDNVASDQAVVCSVTSGEPHQMDLDKLRLACGVFYTPGSRCAFTYPEVLFAERPERYPEFNEDVSKRVGIVNQLGIKFLEEAPYIVHLCGLDPNVATIVDMDRRNARLRCLFCQNSLSLVMDWRNAMYHAAAFHSEGTKLAPLSESPRWQLISDEHINRIQEAERSLGKKFDSSHHSKRCLLCQPRVGNSWRYYDITSHLRDCHGISASDATQGVHYEGIRINTHSRLLEMVECEEQVIFQRISGLMYEY